MAKGITCYERDEMLCDDPGCLHGGGCKLRVVVAQGKPAAWIAFSGEGYVRFWTADADRANAEKQAGLDLRAFTLDELVALISRIPIAKAMAGILAERASAKQPPVEDLVEAIALAAGDLSEHIEKYHDYEFEPGAEPPERGSLRGIQHHLEGSLIDDRGNPVRCSPAEKASEADQQADAIKAMAETEQTDVEFLLQALDQRLLDSIDARNIVKSFRKQIIQVAASCSSQPVSADDQATRDEIGRIIRCTVYRDRDSLVGFKGELDAADDVLSKFNVGRK